MGARRSRDSANMLLKDERARAEAIYTVTRMKWPPGENAKTDELLDKARQVLDDLAADMLEDRPDDWQEHKADMMERYIEAITTAQDLVRGDNAAEESVEHISESAPVPAGESANQVPGPSAATSEPDKQAHESPVAHLNGAPLTTVSPSEHLHGAPVTPVGSAKYLNGEHVNGEHVNGDHVNGEHVNGEHVNGEHVNGEHVNGEPLDNTRGGVDGGEVKQKVNGPKKTIEEKLIESFEQAEAERKKKAQERASVRGMPGSLRRKKKNEQFNSGEKKPEETK